MGNKIASHPRVYIIPPTFPTNHNFLVGQKIKQQLGPKGHLSRVAGHHWNPHNPISLVIFEIQT